MYLAPRRAASVRSYKRKSEPSRSPFLRPLVPSLGPQSSHPSVIWLDRARLPNSTFRRPSPARPSRGRPPIFSFAPNRVPVLVLVLLDVRVAPITGGLKIRLKKVGRRLPSHSQPQLRLGRVAETRFNGEPFVATGAVVGIRSDARTMRGINGDARRSPHAKRRDVACA